MEHKEQNCGSPCPDDLIETLQAQGYDPEISDGTCYHGADDIPFAPLGMEWVLMPARPGGPRYGSGHASEFISPGETGHYSSLNPEPIQVNETWGLSFDEGSALKYLARYTRKGGIEDLGKVKFYADRLIQQMRIQESDVRNG